MKYKASFLVEKNKRMLSMNSDLHKTLLLCPVCKGEMVKVPAARNFKCEHGHTYDIAKEGYVNLLLSNQKKSKNPGDSKDMVAARKDFLSKGYYHPVSNKINETIERFIPKDKSAWSILDLGCGEGYYSQHLKKQLNKNDITIDYYGLDISKEAVRQASKVNKDGIWIVGNNYSIPIPNQSLDCIFSVFSPYNLEECSRVLKKDGILLIVSPRPNHLIEMKSIIYSEVTEKEYKIQIGGREVIKSIEMVEENNVTFQIELPQEDMQSLLKMTPHFWKTTTENKQKLNLYQSLIVTIDMSLKVLKKK